MFIMPGEPSNKDTGKMKSEDKDSKSQSAKKLLKEFTGKFVISIFHSQY